MFETILQGPHGVRSGWRLLTFIFLAAISYIVFSALLSLSGYRPDYAHGIPPFLMLVGHIALFLCPLLAAWIMSRLERKTLAAYGLPARGAFNRRFWAGAALGLAAVTALLIVIRLGRGFSFGGLMLGARGIFYYGILWAAGFLMVALAEEFLFRGYALATLAEGIGFWPAAILLSLAFGAVHLGNLGEDAVGALGAAVVGLLFCFALRRSGSLWFPIGLHAGWDYAESFVYSVPDSGAMVRGHLLNSAFAPGAPAWLTGGSVGPEASVFVFVVLGILFWIVHLMFPTAQFPPARGGEIEAAVSDP
jgi:uncharacterized protein